MEEKGFNKKLMLEIRQKSETLGVIKAQLEKIIEEEKPALLKKLKIDNENREEELGEKLSNLSLINELEKQVRGVININVQNGNVIMDSQLGNNANLTYQSRI